METDLRSIRHIYIFIIFALCGIGLRLVWIQWIQAPGYTERPYEDERLLQAVQRLIAGGGVLVDGELGRIDKERMQQIIPRQDLQSQLIRLDDMGSFEAVNGEIQLSSRALQMQNPRTLRRYPPPKRILDRNGKVLAENSEETDHRYYPYGAATFHVVGHYSPIYQKRGLESLWTTWPRNDIITTLDADLQQKAYELLGQQRGAIVLMDSRTSEVLVMASSPSFDPNQRPGRAWIAASKDKDAQPFLNRAIHQLYPPGSTFKIIVASSLLQRPDFNPHATITCVGRRYRIEEHESHGKTDLFRAISVSCNSYFGWSGVQIGAEAIQQAAAHFGFDDCWTLAPGITSIRSSVPEVTLPYKGLLAQIAIGQYDVRATPLQMAMVAQTVANNGVMVQPRLLRSEVTPAQRRVIPATTAHTLREMMASVMEEGSGNWVLRIYRSSTTEGARYRLAYRNAQDEWLKIGGKTGTAETGRPDDAPHSWFIGFAPLESPRYAVCALIENGGWGSMVAAPIAVKLLAAALAKSEEKTVLLVSNP